MGQPSQTVGGGHRQQHLVGGPLEGQAEFGVEEIVGDLGAEGDVPPLLFVQGGHARGLGVDLEELLVVQASRLQEGLVLLGGASLQGARVGDFQQVRQEFPDFLLQGLSLGKEGMGGVVGHGWAGGI